MPTTPCRVLVVILFAFAAGCADCAGSPPGADDDAGELLDPVRPRDGGPPPPCVPTSCAEASAACGLIPDGCGGALSCGACAAPETCGGGGDASVCGEGSFSCDALTTCPGGSAACGPLADGCGGLLSCGTCADDELCGAGSAHNVCAVPSPDGSTDLCPAPQSCSSAGASCGVVGDGCGDTVSCGGCPAGEVCGGLGVPFECGAPPCSPTSCAEAGAECGLIADGCGGTQNCGFCSGGDICGGGGVASKCGGGEGGGGSECTGLCPHQAYCGEEGATTLTGTVYAPNGTLPLPNVLVYVPNAALPAIAEGASCDRCDDEDLGSPLVSALSDIDGTFTLRHVPADTSFPLVFKLGKWRREVTIQARAPCSTTALSAGDTRLPRNKAEGNIPKTAISTGGIDPMECVFKKLGIDAAEFTRPSEDGRIHLYRANGEVPGEGGSASPGYCGPDTSCGTVAKRRPGGAWPDPGARDCPGCTPAQQQAVLHDVNDTRLYEAGGRIDDYDAVIFACEGSVGRDRDAAHRSAVKAYADAGGRVFFSHWSVQWTYQTSAWQDVAQWETGSVAGVSQQSVYPNPATGLVDVTFPKGAQFSTWLDGVGASYQQAGRVRIYEPRPSALAALPGAQRWIHMTEGFGGDPAYLADSVQLLTFNTPVGQEACGRSIYTGFHVTASNGGFHSDYVHPTDGFLVTSEAAATSHCPAGELTPQEKVLAFMLFDLAACIRDDDTEPVPPPTCTRRTCEEAAVECGAITDGCGGIRECGACEGAEACLHNQCVDVCTPVECADVGAACGVIGDGCGGTKECGECEAGQACGAGGVANQCADFAGCVPGTCAGASAQCGVIGDGCGDTLDCGPCPEGLACGGAGVPYQCGTACVPLQCSADGIECGAAADGCGELLDCGGCAAPFVCGLFEANRCGLPVEG